MTPFFKIDKKDLKYDRDINSQLRSLAQQLQDSNDEYYFLPLEEYLDTFLWVLETNQIPYSLSTPDSV